MPHLFGALFHQAARVDGPITRPYPRPMSQQLTPARFIAKWSPIELSERAASQEHFIDLCRLLGQPTPAEHDATGAEITKRKELDICRDQRLPEKPVNDYSI